MSRPHLPQRSLPCSSADPSRGGPPPNPARRLPILPQPRGVGFVGDPVDEPRMVIGNQHRPLITREQRGALHERAVRVDAFLGAGAAEHERAGIDGVVRKSCTAG